MPSRIDTAPAEVEAQASPETGQPATVAPFCGVEKAARILGDKWTLMVLRDLGHGARHFSDLQTSATGISPRTLVSRLRALEEEGLVARARFRGLPPRVLYSLTEKGRDALPVIEALRNYGNRWLCSSASDSL